MKNALFAGFVLCLVAIVTAGCAQRKIAGQGGADGQAQQSGGQAITEQPLRAPGSQSSISSQQLSEEQARRQRQAQAELDRFLSEVIYFDFDSSVLREDAQALLRAKAAWLDAHKEVDSLTIEGHCDVRGTDAYNMALGERRADEVKAFLVDLGLSPNRFRIISYGEERPAVSGDDESAWGKNRRAVFRLSR